MLPWPRRASALLFLCLLAPILESAGALSAGERKYLPRLGPSSIRFLAPVDLPLPFPLPPLDMGISEKEAAEDEKPSEIEGGDKEKTKKAENRTRVTSISSRPDSSAASNASNSPDSSPVAPLPGSASSQVDIDSLVPDGFDIGLGGPGREREDLSVFLNYFIEQSQERSAGKQQVSPAPDGDAISP